MRMFANNHIPISSENSRAASPLARPPRTMRLDLDLDQDERCELDEIVRIVTTNFARDLAAIIKAQERRKARAASLGMIGRGVVNVCVERVR